jgi:hypothetical protein
LKFTFQIAPTAGGRRDNSSKFGHGIMASRLQPLSVSVRTFSDPRRDVAIFTPLASKRLNSVRLL